MSETYRQRTEMIRQMLTGYGQEPTEERMRFYLQVVQKIPLGSLGNAITSASANATGGYPPGPGDIVSAWRWQTEHPAADFSRPQLEPGSEESILAEMRETAKVLKRAREIREEGTRVPPGFQGRLLSIRLAAEELGVPRQEKAGGS